MIKRFGLFLALAGLWGFARGAVGEGEGFVVNCKEPGTWSVITDRKPGLEAGTEIVRVALTNAQETTTPEVVLSMQFPQADCHAFWNADAWYYNLRPAWREKHESCHVCGYPVFAVLCADGRNRLTVAASDPVNALSLSCGSDERGNVKLNWTVPAGSVPIRSRTIEFLSDFRRTGWSEAVEGASAWCRGFQPRPTVPPFAEDPVYSTWYAFHTDMDAATIEREMELAVTIGVKTLFLDAGWYMDAEGSFGDFCGDWQPSDNRFPDFAGFIRRLHERGARVVLWYGAPLLGPRSAAYAKFKDKALEVKDEGLVVLDPRFPDVREHLAAEAERFVRTWRIDGIKVDFIYWLKGGPDAVPGDGRDIPDTGTATMALVKDLHDRIARVRPDILIEFMHGHHNPAMLPFCNMLRVADCAGDILENRSAMARMRLTSGPVAVHSDMIVWSPSDSVCEAARHVLATLFGTTQFSVRLATLPEEHRKMMAHWIGFARRHGAALRHGKFRPHSPEVSYPVIEGESDDESVAVVYDAQTVACLPNDHRRRYLVNATPAETLVVDCKRNFRATSYDTMGNFSEKTTVSSGVSRLRIPACGFLEVAPED